MECLVKRKVKGHELPPAWLGELGGDPEASYTVTIAAEARRKTRRERTVAEVLRDIRPSKGQRNSTELIREDRERLGDRALMRFAIAEAAALMTANERP